MISKDDLLRALPIRGLRADYGTKSSRTGGAKADVDLEANELNNRFVGRKVIEEALRLAAGRLA